MLDQITDFQSMIDSIRASHGDPRDLPVRGPLFHTGPGVLYVPNESAGEIAAVIAVNLDAAVGALDWPAHDVRPYGFFVEGADTVIRHDSPIFREPTSGLQAGQPRVVRTREELKLKAPRRGGVYRIFHKTGDDRREIYVGQAIDLRRRLLGHEKFQEWSWDTIDKVQLLPLKDSVGRSPVLLIDLDRAESEHIARARREEAAGGPRVVNRTEGRNGRKAAGLAHVYVWSREDSPTPPTFPETPACMRPVENLTPGQRTRRIEHLRETLRHEVATLGPLDRATLSTEFNLSYWLAADGAVRAAVEVVQECYEGRRQVLGPDHSDTLNARHNLAYWLLSSGRRDAARAHAGDVLARRQAVLGVDHFDTLCTRHLVRECSRE